MADQDQAAPSARRSLPLVPLRWNQGRFSTHYAFVGAVRQSVATVSWSTTRDDPKPYVARVGLPGLEGARRHATTLDEAKAIAAAMVNKWLRDATHRAVSDSSAIAVSTDPSRHLGQVTD